MVESGLGEHSLAKSPGGAAKRGLLVALLFCSRLVNTAKRGICVTPRRLSSGVIYE